MLTADNHGKPKGVITCRHLSKYALIFLLLTLSGLIFLLIYMLNLENLSCHTASMLFQPQSSSHTAFAQKAPLPPYYNYTFCSHLEPTPEESPGRSLPPQLYRLAQREWRVGDQLEALVQMHDFQGRPKRYGGDFLVARLHSPELGAGVAGRVVDHLNGSYLALFPLLWQGTAQVVITMVHSSEGVAVLQRLQEQRSDRVFFKSLFRSGKRSETTICNMYLPPNQPKQPLCNYTDLHTGEPWYCLKPKMLSCDTRINHAKGGNKKNLITNKEALLLQSGVNIKVVIHASGPDRINVLPGKKDEIKNSSIIPEPVKYTPSGYYYRGSWRSFAGTTARKFNDSSSITQCLTGQGVPHVGDSTEIKEFNLHSPQRSGPFMAVDSNHNILFDITGCHVVAISIWSHFSTFPVEVLHTPHAATSDGHWYGSWTGAPGTLVVIRSANYRSRTSRKKMS
ncbi:unnamed protein product [Arctogadus glacialis]